MVIQLLVSAFTWRSGLRRVCHYPEDKEVKIALSQPSCKQVRNVKDNNV